MRIIEDKAREVVQLTSSSLHNSLTLPCAGPSPTVGICVALVHDWQMIGCIGWMDGIGGNLVHHWRQMVALAHGASLEANGCIGASLALPLRLGFPTHQGSDGLPRNQSTRNANLMFPEHVA